MSKIRYKKRSDGCIAMEEYMKDNSIEKREC